jgi:hypothetical protein
VYADVNSAVRDRYDGDDGELPRTISERLGICFLAKAFTPPFMTAIRFLNSIISLFPDDAIMKLTSVC